MQRAAGIGGLTPSLPKVGHRPRFEGLVTVEEARGHAMGADLFTAEQLPVTGEAFREPNGDSLPVTLPQRGQMAVGVRSAATVLAGLDSKSPTVAALQSLVEEYLMLDAFLDRGGFHGR